MDPNDSTTGLSCAADCAPDDGASPSVEDRVEDFDQAGPGAGDATVMAWARAM